MSEEKAISNLKKLDIFALPFQFTFGNNEKEKKTIIGGFISLAVLIVSSFYFGYLCYLYFQNMIQPQVVSQNVFEQNSYTLQFKENFIAIQVLMPDGQNLYDYQLKTGKVYLNIISIHFISGMQFQFTPYPLIPCSDEDLSGYLCLDSSKVGDKDNTFSLQYNPENLEENQFSIMFGICDPNLIQSPYTCENEQVVRNALISYQTGITMRINLSQFNTKTKKIEQRVIKEPFYFDTRLGFYTKFHLQKTDLTEQQGFILQNSEYRTYFSGYTRRDIFSSQELIKDQLKLNVLGALEFFIGSESISLNVQYPQFTSLLAQFTSVFNSLLFLGIISKFFAESEIFSQVAEMQLKVYFKKSALFILQQIGQGENVQKEQQRGLDKLLNYIKNANFKNLGKQMKISFLRKIMYVFLGRMEKEEKETIQVKLFKQIVSQSNKALNIFEIQKELLQMKIMMRLILSVEQYAAMQLCGSKLAICNEKEKGIEEIQGAKEEDSQIFNQIVSQDQKLEKSMEIKDDKQNQEDKSQNNFLSFNKEKQDSIRKFSATVYPISLEQQILDSRRKQINLISHLEKIDMVERDECYFKDCLDRFLLSTKQNKSEIDKRILECMIGLDDQTCVKWQNKKISQNNDLKQNNELQQ